jgi:hypothetical protein
MLKEGTPQSAKSISKLPEDVDLGLIFCQTFLDRLCAPIVKRFQGLPLKSDVKESSFASKQKEISNTCFHIFHNTELLESCVQFLKNGSLE